MLHLKIQHLFVLTLSEPTFLESVRERADTFSSGDGASLYVNFFLLIFSLAIDIKKIVMDLKTNYMKNLKISKWRYVKYNLDTFIAFSYNDQGGANEGLGTGDKWCYIKF